MLIIRDGWGTNPHVEWNHANAIHLASTPVNDRLMADYPHVPVHTSGRDVGLPDGVMGNSEVGHQNIGAGRIVEQEIVRITGRIEDGTFYSNDVLVNAFEHAIRSDGNIHLMGLCSDGRVHSDLDHLYGLLKMTCKEVFPGNRVYVHAFMDGRDTPPNAGVDFLEAIEAKCLENGVNPVASVIGRYYAMDRDHRWDRVEQAYRMLAFGEGTRFPSAVAALRDYYDHPSEPNRSGDEFVVPSVVVPDGSDPVRIRDGDSVIFFNFRGDRPRELCAAFVRDEFPCNGVGQDGTQRLMGFDRGEKLDLFFVAMTKYETDLPVHVAFEKPEKMQATLGDYLARLGLRQFRCSETEKYPHVTFFFNDYRDDPFPGEERHLTPSPRDVTTYDQKPEMSAREVTDAMLQRLETHEDDLIVLNLANGDMVGHTGDLTAAVRAVEVVDESVGRVVRAVLDKGGGLIVTADHGNCEQMIDPRTDGPHTAHTTYDVELIVVDDRFRGRTMRSEGRLADIAPTLLEMLGLTKPGEMTGASLLEPAGS